nr:single transducer and activator of transcription 6B [Mus musculus]
MARRNPSPPLQRLRDWGHHHCPCHPGPGWLSTDGEHPAILCQRPVHSLTGGPNPGSCSAQKSLSQEAQGGGFPEPLQAWAGTGCSDSFLSPTSFLLPAALLSLPVCHPDVTPYFIAVLLLLPHDPCPPFPPPFLPNPRALHGCLFLLTTAEQMGKDGRGYVPATIKMTVERGVWWYGQWVGQGLVVL